MTTFRIAAFLLARLPSQALRHWQLVMPERMAAALAGHVSPAAQATYLLTGHCWRHGADRVQAGFGIDGILTEPLNAVRLS